METKQDAVAGLNGKVLKFVPYEPSKAAVGPLHPRSETANLRRYTPRMHSTPINPDRQSRKVTPKSAPIRPQNLISYPKPHIVYSKTPKANSPPRVASMDDTPIDMITPVHTPEVERKLVLHDIGMEMKRETSPESDRESEKSNALKRNLFTSPSRSINNREKVGYGALDNSLQSFPLNKSANFGDDFKSDTFTEKTPLLLTNTDKPPKRPVNVVDPLQYSETSALDISDLESHEIHRLRCLNKSYLKQINDLTHERNEFKKELEMQFQVNTELKKLLVASVGADVQHDVEHIIREKSQLTHEIGDYQKKVSADSEVLDKISIQADMWRSKFIASRVMIDELAHWKAHLSVRYRELQAAVLHLLQERTPLKAQLLETYRYLQLIKDAFHPHPNKIHKVAVSNVLELAKLDTKLAEDVKMKLLGNLQKSEDIQVVCEGRTDALTPAEALAQEVLFKSENHGSPQVLPPTMRAPTASIIDRFHPDTKFDNLTVSCCKNCQGDISVV